MSSDSIVSWFPGVGQSVMGAIVFGSAVLIYRRVRAVRRAATRTDFELSVVNLFALRPAGSSDAGRLAIYIAYRLARLFSFGAIAIVSVVIANVISAATFSWINVSIEVLWLVLGIFGTFRAVSAYFDLAILHRILVKDSLTLPAEKLAVVKSEIDRHFEREDKPVDI